jgi:RND family efflux transporter MFP subunit
MGELVARVEPIMSIYRGISTALLLLAASVALAGCKAEAEQDPRTSDALVRLATASPAFNAERAFTGVVTARVISDLGFRVSGKVVERLVDTGQMVRAGQPLMRIDNNDLDLAIAAKEQAVFAARARVIQTVADEDRYRKLYPTGATSKESYEKAKADADSARATLAAAEADAKVAHNQGGYALLAADADGTVVNTLVEPGQVVAAGQIVVKLADSGPREASVYLPETMRPKVGSSAQAVLYGASDTVGSAHLRQLSDAADLQTRTYEARYVLDGEAAAAPLGATVTVRIPSDALNSDVVVPLGALDDNGVAQGVWVFDKTSSTVSFHPVKVKRLDAESAFLSDGLKVGEAIVALGGHFLREGEKVRISQTLAAAK